MLARRALGRGRWLAARYASSLISIRNALSKKDFARASQDVLELTAQDIDTAKQSHKAMASQQAIFAELSNTPGDKKSPLALQTLWDVNQKYWQLGLMSFRTCATLLSLSLELNIPEKGIEFWVQYLESLGRATKKPISEIVSKPNHMPCSLLALGAYFMTCQKNGVAAEASTALRLVPLSAVPSSISTLTASPYKVDAKTCELIRAELSKLRKSTLDFSSPQYIDSIRQANFGEVQSLYDEAKAAGSIPETVYAEFVRRFAETRQHDTSLKVWNDMMGAGITPTVVGWNSLLRVASLYKTDSLKNVEALWSKMTALKIEPDSNSYAIRLATYEKNGKLDEAVDLFKKLRKEHPEKIDIFVFNNMLNSIVAGKYFASAEQLFKWALDSGLEPNIVSYNTMIRSTNEAEKPELASKYLDMMTRENVRPDIVTYGQSLDLLFKNGNKLGVDVSEYVNDLLSEMASNKIKANPQFLTILGDGVSKSAGDVRVTRKIFKIIQKHSLRISVITFGAFIESELRNGDFSKAKQYFNIMKEYGLPPSIPTHNQMINGAIKEGLYDEALNFFKKLSESTNPRLHPNVYTYMFIVDAVSKRTVDSMRPLLDAVFECIPRDKDVIDYPLASRIMKVAKLTTVSPEVLEIAGAALTKRYDSRKQH